MPNLRDFLNESIFELPSGVEQKIYTVAISNDSHNLILQQFILALAEYFVICWLSPTFGSRDTIWTTWNTGSDDECQDMLQQLQSAFCDNEGHVADDLDPYSGKTHAKGNFGETLLRWIEETFRQEDKRFIPAAPQPSSEGSIDLIETIFLANGTWFAILWECKATRQIAGAVSRAYKQLDDYPNRLYFIANDRASQFEESDNSDSQYAQTLRFMPMEAKRRTNRIHYGVLIAHDASEKQPNLRDLHKHPEDVPPGCHHLIFVALPDFSALRDAVWRAMRLR